MHKSNIFLVLLILSLLAAAKAGSFFDDDWMDNKYNIKSQSWNRGQSKVISQGNGLLEVRMHDFLIF